MAFVPAPRIAMVEIRATLANQLIENRIYVHVTVGTVEGLLADIANIVNGWVQGTYFDLLPDTVTLREVVATDMSVENGAQHTIAPVGPFVGARVGNPMPNEVTCCLSLRTGFRGRSARGRFYWLAIPAGEVTGNIISSSYLADVVAAGNALKTLLAANAWEWTIVSFVSNKNPRPGGPVYFFVDSTLVTDNVVDSMRSRKPGVGQ
jgi:hypothetical protein